MTEVHKVYISWTGTCSETPLPHLQYAPRQDYYTDEQRSVVIEIWVEKFTHLNTHRIQLLNEFVMWYVRNHGVCSPGQLRYVSRTAVKGKKLEIDDDDPRAYMKELL